MYKLIIILNDMKSSAFCHFDGKSVENKGICGQNIS